MSAAFISRALLCAISIAAPTLAQQSSTYKQAQQAFVERRYSEAAKLFRQAANEPHNEPDAILMEGKSLINIGDFPAADSALRSYLDRNARSAPALYLLGFVLQRQNKPQESLEVFTRAAAITPPLSNDLKIVGLDYVLLNDYPDAIHWLQRAVEMDPANEEAWYDLGRAQMTQGKVEIAEHAFDRALSIKPSDIKALNNLGLSYEAQNRVQEALRAYEKAIAVQQGNANPSEQPLLNYGTLLITQNRGADAVAALLKAIELAPKNGKCRESLARAYLIIGKLPEARQQMEAAVGLDPNNSRLHFELGRIYRRLGLAERAEAELKLSASLYGTHSTPE